jgi:hypothetical protein
VLVEIETGVELRLLRQKIFETGFVLEGAAQFGSVICHGLLLVVDFVLFVLGFMIKHTQDMLDA